MDHTTLSKSVGPTKLDNVGREERVVNGPLKNRSLGKFEFYPSLGISAQLMGLEVSDFVSVGHIFSFLLSHNTFSSQARILRCQSQRLGESRIYHSPPLED